MRIACRRFTLQDAVILVAGMALSVWIGQGRLVEYPAAKAWEEGLQGHSREALVQGLVAIRELQPGVAVLTLVVLGLRLQHPRPALRRLARQPGFMAGCAVALVLVVRGLSFVAVVGRYRLTSPPDWGCIPAHDARLQRSRHRLCRGCRLASSSVNRRWHRERSWIDQIGLILGLYWVGRILAVIVPVLLK